MVFQIRMRLFCVSATNSLPFCTHTPCGARTLLALTTTGSVRVVKSGWPNTTSAGWPIYCGMLSHSSTRLLPVSATATTFPSVATPSGRFMPCEVRRRGGLNVGLPDHQRGLAQADRTQGGVGEFVGGLGKRIQGKHQ